MPSIREEEYEEDEEDFYGQDFDKDGVVSIWVSSVPVDDGESEIDVLQDLCGVGYYDLSTHASNFFDNSVVSIEELLAEVSFSDSFVDAAVEAAGSKGVDADRCIWITLQYDFAYDPLKVKRPVANDPVFLGYFSYSKD